MTGRSDDRLYWLETALQGLCFWIGHRHALFRDYPLTEGALVGELCNLIQANKPDYLTLFPEKMYKAFIPKSAITGDWPGLTRADLILCSKSYRQSEQKADLSQAVRFVIEVKRAVANQALILDDLKRLAKYLSVAGSGKRGFLVVIGESGPPEKFVTVNGNARREKPKIDDTDACYQVRRVLKAASSFNGQSSAHYACLIEVKPGRPNGQTERSQP